MKLTRTQHANLYVNPESGIFYVRKMVRGKPRTLSTGFATEKQALRRSHEIISALENTKAGWGVKELPSVEEWWKAYREAKKKSPNTWRREQEIMDTHVFPFMGKLRLDEVTQNLVERYLTRRRRAKAAEGTVTREQSLLHAVFEAAVDDDLISKNPLRKIPRTPYASRQRVVNLDEQAKLLDTMSEMLGRWLIFMLGTGVRIEEVRGIRPSTDIEWDAKRFKVTGKGHNGEAKERWVPILHPEVERVMREQIAENEGSSKRHRSKRGDSLWRQSQGFFRKELTKVCKEAKVSYFSPHILRHTFATRYLQSGGDIFVLSQILGHYSVEVTQRVYAHLLTEDHAKLSAHVDLGLHRKARVLRFG